MTTRERSGIAPMEAELEALLRPIRPSRNFVQTVHKRIKFEPATFITNKTPEARRFLLILGGVLSASLLVITTVRAIFYLVNRQKA